MGTVDRNRSNRQEEMAAVKSKIFIVVGAFLLLWCARFFWDCFDPTIDVYEASLSIKSLFEPNMYYHPNKLSLCIPSSTLFSNQSKYHPVYAQCTTVNVPLPPGCGDGEWVHALERYVEPAVSRFEPELVLVSAGFDAHEDEDIYLVDMHVTENGFRELARRCATLARPHRASSPVTTPPHARPSDRCIRRGRLEPTSAASRTSTSATVPR